MKFKSDVMSCHKECVSNNQSLCPNINLPDQLVPGGVTGELWHWQPTRPTDTDTKSKERNV